MVMISWETLSTIGASDSPQGLIHLVSKELIVRPWPNNTACGYQDTLLFDLHKSRLIVLGATSLLGSSLGVCIADQRLLDHHRRFI